MKKKLLAEGIGTMVLVLMGCGAAVLNGGATSVAAVLTIAFAFGLSVVAMAYCLGPISGCHINPAITLGLLLAGRMKACEAVSYMAAQVVGAAVGSAILLPFPPVWVSKEPVPTDMRKAILSRPL